MFLIAFLLPAALGLPLDAAPDAEASVINRFTDELSPLVSPAVVDPPLVEGVMDDPEAADAGEDPEARRRLGWRFWEKNEDAVWKATSSCPWVCKQGWWWQSDAYAKPACCDEVRDSPYDNCEHETCSCDASCRSCCD